MTTLTTNELIATSLNDRDIVQTTISRDAARRLAATMHTGPATALGRFAATGELDVARATVELWDHVTDAPPEWWEALDRFLDQEVRYGKA